MQLNPWFFWLVKVSLSIFGWCESDIGARQMCAPEYRYDGASVIDSDQLIQLCNIYMRRASYEKPLY